MIALSCQIDMDTVRSPVDIELEYLIGDPVDLHAKLPGIRIQLQRYCVTLIEAGPTTMREVINAFLPHLCATGPTEARLVIVCAAILSACRTNDPEKHPHLTQPKDFAPPRVRPRAHLLRSNRPHVLT